MPIKPENKILYPKNWKTISAWVIINAGNQCEICDAKNHKPHPVTKSNVVLTVHHQDFNPKNNSWWNLIALCQRCHNRLDKRYRRRDKAPKDFPIAEYDPEVRWCLN